MNARSHVLTGTTRSARMGLPKRERKGAAHASWFCPFFSVRIDGCAGGTDGHHHLRSLKNVSKRWGSPQSVMVQNTTIEASIRKGGEISVWEGNATMSADISGLEKTLSLATHYKEVCDSYYFLAETEEQLVSVVKNCSSSLGTDGLSLVFFDSTGMPSYVWPKTLSY